jgi:hypothetical protein
VRPRADAADRFGLIPVGYHDPSGTAARCIASLEPIATPPSARRCGGEDHPHAAVRRLGRPATAGSPPAGSPVRPAAGCGRARCCSRRHSRGASAAGAARLTTNEPLHLLRDRRPPGAMLRDASPIEAEALAVPTDHGVRFDDDESIFPAGPGEKLSNSGADRY